MKFGAIEGLIKVDPFPILRHFDQLLSNTIKHCFNINNNFFGYQRPQQSQSSAYLPSFRFESRLMEELDSGDHERENQTTDEDVEDASDVR